MFKLNELVNIALGDYLYQEYPKQFVKNHKLSDDFVTDRINLAVFLENQYYPVSDLDCDLSFNSLYGIFLKNGCSVLYDLDNDVYYTYNENARKIRRWRIVEVDISKNWTIDTRTGEIIYLSDKKSKCNYFTMINC